MKNVRRKILVPESVAVLVRNMHPQLKKKIRSSFQVLMADPHAGKALKEELAGLGSLRVGRHRVIHRLPQNDRIEIVAVGSRESIYKETYRLLQKQER
jgi:mRNA interferase RelE/StbE